MLTTMSEDMPDSSKQPRRIQLSETEGFSREGFDGHIYYTAADGTLSLLRIDVHGSHPRKRMMGDTTRTYTVLDGTGRFTLGNETHDVQSGDVFVIPPDGEYHYEGQMTLDEVNSSPSGNIQDQKLEQIPFSTLTQSEAPPIVKPPYPNTHPQSSF